MICALFHYSVPNGAGVRHPATSHKTKPQKNQNPPKPTPTPKQQSSKINERLVGTGQKLEHL